MGRRWWSHSLVALAALLVVSGLGACGNDAGSEAGDPTRTRASGDTVTVSLRVVGCRGCTVTAYKTVNGKARSLGSRSTDQAFPSWDVPPDQTKGMAFTIATSTKPPKGGTRTAVVMQYEGVEPASPMNDRTAAKQDRGTYCWAGTRDSILMTVKVRKPSKAASGTSKPLLAYADLMRTGFGDFIKTDRGVLTVKSNPRCPQ
jgi:hypothetical protein